MTDDLVQLIAELRQEAGATGGRRRLLEYTRVHNAARMALLFALDKRRDALLLVERRGRRARSLPAQSPRDQPGSVPLTGIFGAALHGDALLFVPRAAADPRALGVERFWLAPGDDVIACRIVQRGEAAGVLVLCRASDRRGQSGNEATKAPPAIDEEGLLICSALLSAYLPAEEPPESPVVARTWQARSTYRSVEPRADAIEAAIEEERERIARDIHDGVAQQLASVLHKLDLARRSLESRPETASRALDEAALLLSASLDELRRLIASPVPFSLETQTLVESLRRLIAEMMRAEPSLRVELESDDLSLLPASLETVVYRLVQEGLTNARKHAQATRAFVRLRLLNGLLVVEIGDNGRGFDLEQEGYTGAAVDNHLGLKMMRSRVQQAGGMWDVRSRRGEGTLIRARFPLAVPLVSEPLTRREREVLDLITQGLTNRAIAEKLSVSAETVKSHLHHIMQKMHVHDRTQAAVKAARQQLV